MAYELKFEINTYNLPNTCQICNKLLYIEGVESLRKKGIESFTCQKMHKNCQKQLSKR